jgi:hypothetical protein
VFDGPELERVIKFVEHRERDSPPVLREQAMFYHLRAWACHRLPLPRGQDYPKMRDIELMKQDDRIVGVKVYV